MIKIIKRIVPQKLKQEIIYFKNYNRCNEYQKIAKKNKVIIMLAADYGNLGDLAITHAQKEFLKRMYPSYEIVELPMNKTFTHLKSLKAACNKSDIITIIGGGNMGDLYYGIESQRQFIISKFKKNKIISFPQTIDFSHTEKGEKALRMTSKIYSKHPDLTIVAREKISYRKMKEVFPKNHVILTPDIVLSLDKTEPVHKRDGILLCLRDDKEKYLDNKQQEELIQRINREFSKVESYDTHLGEGVFSIEKREEELEKIWTAFKKSKVVVTDRLHGMIFAYITKTPCIAIPNNNHKVKGSFEWIKKCKYIVLCEENNVEGIMSNIHQLYNLDLEGLELIDLKKEFSI